MIAIKGIHPAWGRGSEVLLIQCKNLAVERPLSKLEKDNLKKLAKQTGGTPLHVYNDCRHKIVAEEIE